MEMRYPEIVAAPSGAGPASRWRVSRRKHGRGSVPVVLAPEHSWTFKRPYGEAAYGLPAPSRRGKRGTIAAAFLLLGALLALTAGPTRPAADTPARSPAGARLPRR